MAKVKPVKASATPVTASPAKVLNGVKRGRITKPSQSEPTKSKGISKSATVKKELEKKIRNPTPSDSEDVDDSADDSSNDSSSDSDSEIESETDSDGSSASESEQKKKKTSSKTKVNGLSKEDDSDSSSESDEDQEKAPKARSAAAASRAAVKEEHSSDSDTDSSESDDDNIADVGKFQPDSDASEDNDDDDDDDDDEEDDSSDSGDEKVGDTPARKVNGVTKKAEAIAEDSEASSSDDSSDSEDLEEAKPEPKKRKADEATEPSAKKTRVENSEREGQDGTTKTLFIGRLSWNVDDESLYQEFQEFGEIVSCKVMYHRDSGKSKGFGYVEFSTAEEATAAKEAKHEAMIDGRPVNIDFATPFQGVNKRDPKDAYQQRSRKFGDVESAPSSTIFVGNISFDATYDMIKEAFEQYGTIERISLPTSKEDGTPKGFGYVSFSTTEEATQAINNLRGSEIAGRPVRLDFATPRPEGDGSGGGFRGGRGGNRGGGRGGFGGGRGGGGFGFGRGGRGGAPRGGRGGTTNRGGFGDFSGRKISF